MSMVRKSLLALLLVPSATLLSMEKDSASQNSNRSFFVKADQASSKIAAFLALQKSGYVLQESDLVRKANQETGAGFWDAMVPVQGTPSRIISYGPGEYVSPHFHNEEEVFNVRGGGCDFWMLEKVINEWKYFQIQSGQQIRVPATIIHCLVADDKEGLCMHISRDDSTRSVVFVPEYKIPLD